MNWVNQLLIFLLLQTTKEKKIYFNDACWKCGTENVQTYMFQYIYNCNRDSFNVCECVFEHQLTIFHCKDL